MDEFKKEALKDAVKEIVGKTVTVTLVWFGAEGAGMLLAVQTDPTLLMTVLVPAWSYAVWTKAIVPVVSAFLKPTEMKKGRTTEAKITETKPCVFRLF